MTPDLLIGTQLGRFRLVSVLGRGGMGVVYRAEDGSGRPVAIKVIAPELSSNPEFRERFLREADSALSHPHIVPIYGAGDEAGRLYMRMRLIEGTDLKKLIANEGRPRPARVVSLISQAAEALDFAHSHSLVHRDIKPQNLLIEADGASEHLFVTDFGLVKRVSGESSFTSSGHVVGSAPYMAPEQIKGSGVDGRIDVYALGCVLYECLTGRVPYTRDEEVAVLWAHVNEPVPKPSEEVEILGHGIDDVVAKAMAKDPNDRYLTAGDLAAAVAEEFGTTGVRVQRPWVAPRMLALNRRPTASPAAAESNQPRVPVRTLVAGVAAALLLTSIAVGLTREPTSSPAGSGRDDVGVFADRERGSEPAVRRAAGDQPIEALVPSDTPVDLGLPQPGDGDPGAIQMPVLSSPALSSIVPRGSTGSRALVVFTSNRRYSVSQRQFHHSMDLLAMDASGHQVRNLSPADPDKTEILPALSPCRGLAYTRTGGPPQDQLTLFIKNPEGELLYRNDHHDYFSSQIDWAPDCVRLVLVRGGLSVMDAAGGNQELLFEHPGGPLHPRWSPDGRRIAFDLGVGTENRNTDIHVIGANGRDLTRLTSDSAWESNPVWSPDGKWIAFRKGVLGEGEGDVWIMRADGTDQRRLTDAIGDDRPIAWSPDGRYIAFYTDRETGGGSGEVFLKGDIYIMAKDGSQERDLIPDNSGDEGWLAWQPPVFRNISAQVDEGAMSGRVRALHAPCQRHQHVAIESRERSSWRFVGSVITSADGRFTAPLPGPGVYRARLALSSARGGLVCGVATTRP